jgi:hypothetical protein
MICPNIENNDKSIKINKVTWTYRQMDTQRGTQVQALEETDKT